MTNLGNNAEIMASEPRERRTKYIHISDASSRSPGATQESRITRPYGKHLPSAIESVKAIYSQPEVWEGV